MKPLQLGVFASGRGSNFEAILKAIDEGQLHAGVKLLLSNNADAGALETAKKGGIPAVVLNRKMFDCRNAFIRQMISVLKFHGVDLIALAGYMKKIPAEVIREFPNKILNIHPALLPAFGGRGSYGYHVHEAVLEYGCKVSGVTVHFVDELYDHGPIIAQRTVPVEDDDTAKTLAARVLKIEHQIYPEVLQWFAEDRVHVKSSKVIVNK